jgi:hypothetical protein
MKPDTYDSVNPAPKPMPLWQFALGILLVGAGMAFLLLVVVK